MKKLYKHRINYFVASKAKIDINIEYCIALFLY